MANEPNSYKDSYWSDLASGTESKLGLPKGVLVSLLMNGERSNADQVSEAGAKTPFQIIPATRNAAIKKYGIDPYLSPANAAEVAGNLIKDSLARNKGDIPLAVAEYHGGTDRANWGPRTKAYVHRVTAALPNLDAELTPANVGNSESTFQRVSKQQQAPEATSKLNAVYQAYKSGQMTPEESQQFEADVKSGSFMLPKGASIDVTPQANKGATELPREVANAYEMGQMSPQEKAQLEGDIKSGLVKLPPSLTSQIPGPNGEQVISKPQQTPEEPSLMDKAGDVVRGTGELFNSAVMVVPTAGAFAVGGMQGILDSAQKGTFGTQQGVKTAEQKALEYANQIAYKPQTNFAKQTLQTVGNVAQNLIPLAGVAPEMALIQQAAKPAVMQAVQAVKQGGTRAAQAVAEAVPTITQRASQMLPGRSPSPTPTPGTFGSAGSAATDIATMRRANAASLEVPIKLTEGQATRDFAQTQFEREAAKNPTAGTPLRQRFEEQNGQILKNFDAWIDQTGAESGSLRDTGLTVTKAIKEKADAIKTKIRDLYKKADAAGELEAPVKLEELVKHINESAPEASTAPILDVARKKLIQIGAATEGANGELIALEVPLKKSEMVRQSISRATNFEPTNIRQSSIMKSLIDAQTEGLGGNLYQQARRTRAQFAREFENRAVISDLLNKKRGMDDRKVAFEDVHKRAILDGSLDDVRMVRRTLQTQGEEGKQAWRELQGATLQHIKDAAAKNVGRDSRGSATISPAGLDKAVKALDKDGKLDFIFGKQNAQKIRDLNDLAKVVFTTPPNSVNSSNTASILLAALDGGLITSTGIPLPVASGLRIIGGKLKDRKLAARVTAALK